MVLHPSNATVRTSPVTLALLMIGLASLVGGALTDRAPAGVAVATAAAVSAGLVYWAPRRAWLLVAAAAFTLLTPNLNVIPGLPLIRMEQVLWGILLVDMLLQGQLGQTLASEQLRPLTWVLTGLLLTVVASIIRGVARREPFSMRDLTELLWPLAYLAIAATSFWVARAPDQTARRFMGWVLGIGLVGALVAILQFYNVLWFNDWISPWYLGTPSRKAHLVAVIQSKRLYGTAGNAGLYGAMMGILLVTAVAQFLRGLGRKWVSLTLVSLATVALFTSLARTAVAATAAGAAFVVFSSLGWPLRWRRDQWVSLGAVLSVAALGFGIVSAMYLTEDQQIRNGFLHRVTGVVTASAAFTEPVSPPTPPPAVANGVGAPAQSAHPVTTTPAALTNPAPPVGSPSVPAKAPDNNVPATEGSSPAPAPSAVAATGGAPAATPDPTPTSPASAATAPAPEPGTAAATGGAPAAAPPQGNTSLARALEPTTHATAPAPQFRTRQVNRFLRDLGIRYRHWTTYLEDGVGLLGVGPTKDAITRVADSEYVLFIRRYGVLGFALYLGLFGLLFWGLRRAQKQTSDPDAKALCAGAQGAAIVGVLYGSLAATYYSTQVMGLMLLLGGAAIALAVRNEPTGPTPDQGV